MQHNDLEKVLLRFAYLSDLQQNTNFNEVSKWVNEINSKNPDFTIVNGDWIYYSDALLNLNNKVYLNLGNHDHTLIAKLLEEKNPNLKPIYSPTLVKEKGVNILFTPGAIAVTKTMFVNGPGNILKVRNKEEGKGVLESLGYELLSYHQNLKTREEIMQYITMLKARGFEFKIENNFEGSGHYLFEPIYEEVKKKVKEGEKEKEISEKLLVGYKIRKLSEKELNEFYQKNKGIVMEYYNKIVTTIKKNDFNSATTYLSQLTFKLGLFYIVDMSEVYTKYKGKKIDIVFSHDPPHFSNTCPIDSVYMTISQTQSKVRANVGDEILGKLIKENNIPFAIGGHLEESDKAVYECNGELGIAYPNMAYTSLYANFSTTGKSRGPIYFTVGTKNGKLAMKFSRKGF